MRRRCLPILLVVAVFILAAAGSACGGENPIRITSDRLDAYDDKAFVLFSGSVVATQDDTVIHADELFLYYDRKKGSANSPPDAAVRAGKIQRIELRGNVTMEKGERIVTGKRAIFHNDDQTFVVTGNAVMRERNNVITGDRITVFLKENRGIVESSGTKERVTATIYPEKDAHEDETRREDRDD